MGRMEEIGGDDGFFKPTHAFGSFHQANVVKLQARPATGGDVNPEGKGMASDHMGARGAACSYRSRFDRSRNFNPFRCFGESRSQ